MRGYRSPQRELAVSLALQCVVNLYHYVLMAQVAESAACLRFHLIGSRLARWLLVRQNCAHSQKFRMTHEFLTYTEYRRRGSWIDTMAGDT